MSSKNCLNCGHELSNNFCSYCGQKADTHRITVKHFIQHDLLHGVFHLDKGILFTIKETFTRPGKAAMDYINGKRISYYNIFYLILLIVGLNLLVQHYIHELSNKSSNIVVNKDGVKFLHFFEKNIKYIILSFIPLFAINGWLVFRRLKLNIAEHHIVAGFVLLGCSILFLIMKLFNFLPDSWLVGFVGYIRLFVGSLVFIFPIFVYYLAFGSKYKTLGFSWRLILMYLLFGLEFVTGLLIIVGLLTKGNFEGEIKFI